VNIPHSILLSGSQTPGLIWKIKCCPGSDFSGEAGLITGPVAPDFDFNKDNDLRGGLSMARISRALHVIAGVMALSLLLPLIIAPPQRDERLPLTEPVRSLCD
jgi:hypothetical protein